MEYPSNVITGTTDLDENPTVITVHVQSDRNRIDETALTQHIQQWAIDNVSAFVQVTAARHEQTFPVTPLPPLGE